MYSRSFILPIIIQVLAGICLAQSDHLNFTTVAIVNNVSVIQCWQLNRSIVPISAAKSSTLGAFRDPVNATWLSAPAGTPNPEHTANAIEYNVILSGTLHLGVYETGQTATIKGGAHGLLLVTDTTGNGNSAAITDDAPAVALTLPIKEGVIPCYVVLHDGQCLDEEMNF
ncbi:MAG: hypothetical protein M1820_008278 [Bogoriella megaspora]|nr:MAG: hypothetical protein M1820_008278 [Bogoriella megaspora]